MPLEVYAQKSANVDYSKMSLATLKQKALNNDAEAQFEYGQRLRGGIRGVDKNEKEGLEWLRKSGLNGLDASYSLLLMLLEDKQEYEKRIEVMREGISVHSENCLFAMFKDYSDGENGLPKSDDLARKLLIQGCDFKMTSFFYYRYLAHKYGKYGLKVSNNDALFWLKKSCDYTYDILQEYKRSGDGSKIDYWSKNVKEKLEDLKKEFGCIYEPALYHDEYLAWLKDKSLSASISSSPKSTMNSANNSASSNDSKPQSFIYTESGRGQSQKTGQWTDPSPSMDCVVEFFDDHITVNGMYCKYLRTTGAWKIYEGMNAWGNANYYHVDGNKNMKKVCDFSSAYGFDTFVYPMSLNGDPTPMGNNVNNDGYVNSNGTNNNSGTGSATQPARKFKCAYCNGTGRIERNDNAPASFGQSKANKKCNECGKIYDPTVFNHYHVQCGHCGGTGNAK